MTTSEGTLTPREVEEVLGLSAPAVRRAALAYEAVFGPLPRLRGREGPRQWPVEAVRRVQVAHTALESGRVISMEHGLKLIHDGQELPTRPDLPNKPDHVAELVATVEVLRLEVAALRGELMSGRELPKPGLSGDEVREIVRAEVESALGTLTGDRSPSARAPAEVREVVRDELDRLRVMLHAAAPTPTRRRSWLARVLGLY